METIKNIKHYVSFAWLLLLIACSNSEEKIIDPGEPIHHDDFEYVVDTFSIQKNIEGDTSILTAKGNYYLISFKVINNAKRVNHLWNNTVAYVMDEKGVKYENNREAQITLNSLKPFGYKGEYNTAFQTTETTILIFDLPEDVKEPYFMVRGETLMGDLFSSNQFRKTKVKLF